MIYILAIAFIVLLLAWISYNKQPRPEKEALVYREGNNLEPDSDADMQEQYNYRNHKNEE